MPQTNFNNGQMEYEMKHIQPTRNIVHNIPKVETEGLNTQTQDHKHMQTTPYTFPKNIQIHKPLICIEIIHLHKHNQYNILKLTQTQI